MIKYLLLGGGGFAIDMLEYLVSEKLKLVAIMLR